MSYFDALSSRRRLSALQLTGSRGQYKRYLLALFQSVVFLATVFR